MHEQFVFLALFGRRGGKREVFPNGKAPALVEGRIQGESIAQAASRPCQGAGFLFSRLKRLFEPISFCKQPVCSVVVHRTPELHCKTRVVDVSRLLDNYLFRASKRCSVLPFPWTQRLLQSANALGEVHDHARIWQYWSCGFRTRPGVQQLRDAARPRQDQGCTRCGN